MATELSDYIDGLPELPSAPVTTDKMPIVRDGEMYAVDPLSLGSGGEPPSAQPITLISPPKFAADGATLKQGVPVTRVAGTYSAGTVTQRYRTRGAAPNEVTVSNGGDASYTPVADDVGKVMTYYEVVTNSVTGEVKTFASAPVGPILPPDPTEFEGLVEEFDFTDGTSHSVAVARSGSAATRRSGAATVAIMSANTKRYEHDASGNQIGLLCEKARTNLFTNADDISAVTTATSNATKTQNYGTAPDGTTSSTRVTAQAGAHSRGIGVPIAPVGSASKFSLWVKGAAGQSYYIRDPDSGEYVAKGPTNGSWQLVEEQGTSAPPSNHYNWMLYNDGTALDVEVWGAGLQAGTGYQTLVMTTGSSATRPKEVWTVTLSGASVTRDIQIEDHLGQTQNFVDQAIGSGATWQLDADSITISPVIKKLRVYTQGSLTGGSPPSAPPPPPPPTSGDFPTISMADLIDFMENPDDATAWAASEPGDPYPPARQACIQTPLNIDGVRYICEYPRNDGGAVPSNFYNEWDAVPLWLWIYRSNEWSASGKRIQYRRLLFCLLLDGPDGEWVSSQVHPRLGSRSNTQLWNGRSAQGSPSTLDSMMRDESEANGGGSSVLLTGKQGVEMWANPGFYAMHSRANMARAFAGAGIVEIRVINDDRSVYTGNDAKPLAALGGDLYSPNVQNPRMDSSGIPRAMDGFKSRWKKIDCSGGWQPVAFVTCDFCYKKDGPRPPWGNYTGSWDVTSSEYNLTKTQLMANPPPFVSG